MRATVGVSVSLLAGNINPDASLVADLLQGCTLGTNDTGYSGSGSLQDDGDLGERMSVKVMNITKLAYVGSKHGEQRLLGLVEILPVFGLDDKGRLVQLLVGGGIELDLVLVHDLFHDLP